MLRYPASARSLERSLTLALLTLLLGGVASRAQYSKAVFDLKKAQELYDERGFEQSKAISVDGSLVVSNSNGNVSYSYPIASYTQGGYPIKVDLNYCGSAGFTTFKKCVLANQYTETSPSTEYVGWSKFHQNRPVWILGVNGFAINALVSSTHFLNDPTNNIYAQGQGYGGKRFYDKDIVWSLDGYDFSNRMTDFDAVGTGNTFVDVIKLLRSDGSLLELRQSNERITQGDVDTMAHYYTGYYRPKEANAKGYAYVSFDYRNWIPAMREYAAYLKGQHDTVCTIDTVPEPNDTLCVTNWKYQGLAFAIPRRVDYFDGDGLQYVFREWVAPFGAFPYRDTPGRTGGIWAGPTMFYLDEIRCAGRQLISFWRERHFPSYRVPVLDGDPYPDDSTRGRALITSCNAFYTSWGMNSVQITAQGRTTTVKFGKILASGNAIEGGTVAQEVPWFPITMNGAWSDLTRSRTILDDSNPVHYKSWIAYVTEIIDPMGRKTTFDYERYRRIYKGWSWPRSDVEDTVDLSNVRLSRVIEPTSEYRLTYYGGNGGTPVSGGDTLWVTPTDTAKYRLSNRVATLKKYDRSWRLLRKDSLSFSGVINGHDTSRLVSYDSLNNTTRITTTVTKPWPLGTDFDGDVGGTFTSVERVTESAVGEKITTVTPHADTDGLILPSMREVIYEGTLNGTSIGQTMRKELYSYLTGIVRTFGGDSTLAGLYGREVVRKTTRRYDGNANLLTVDTTRYLHLPYLDTTYAFTRTVWDKYATIAKYLALRDSLRAINITPPSWESLNRPFSTFPIYTTSTDTGTVSFPPIFGVEQSTYTYNASGTLLTGIGRKIDSNVVAGLTTATFARGRSVVDTVIGEGGSPRVVQSRVTYDNVEGNTLPHLVENANGAILKKYYQWLWPERIDSLGAPLPVGNAKFNDNSVLPSDVDYGDMGASYDMDLGQGAVLRRVSPGGTVTTDTIRTLVSRTFYGRPKHSVDQNGWVSSYDYDYNGRLLKAALPYDMQRADSIYHNIDSGMVSADGYGWTDWTVTDALKCCDPGNTNHNHTTPTPEDQTSYEGIFADKPIEYEPECCPTPMANGKEGASLMGTCNGDKSYEIITPAIGKLRFDGLPDDVDSIVRLDSAFLEFQVSNISRSWVTLKVAAPSQSFETTYLLAATEDTTDSLGGNVSIPRFRIDLASILSQLSTGGSIVFEFTTSSTGARVDIASTIEAADNRPRLALYGVFRRSNPFGDYTLKYAHDDPSLQTTVEAKVDDLLHTSNLLDQDSLRKFSRHTVVRHHHGADYRTFRSDITVGNPYQPQRIDTVHFGHTGSGIKDTVRDQSNNVTITKIDALGRPVAVTNADGTRSEVSYLLAQHWAFGLLGQNFHGLCSTVTARNEVGIISTRYFDALGRLRREVADSGGLNLTTRYEYDVLNRLTSVINPNGDTTRYWYDALGRVKYKYQPDIDTVSYAYDNVGNIRFSQSQEQANADLLTYSQYDDLNRLVVTGEARITRGGGGGGGLDSESKGKGGSLASAPALNRLTDVISATSLQKGSNPNGHLTFNSTLWLTPSSYGGAMPPTFFDYTSVGEKIASTVCAMPPNAHVGETTIPVGPFLKHQASLYEPDTARRASTSEFEHLAKYPEFIRIGVNYDAFPSRSGPVWGQMPFKWMWDTLAPTGALRNLKGREVAVAYREHGGEPFHYAVMSYDERGRVEALLRYTDNLGFDAVYYTYNSMNLVTSVRLVDLHRQHTTWYGYDHNGRVDSVWTKLDAVGSGLRGQPGNMGHAAGYRTMPARPTTADILYSYTKTGQVEKMDYPPVGAYVLYAYNPRLWLDSMIVFGPVNGGMLTTKLFTEALRYDSSGQIIQQQSEHYGSARRTVDYGYDNVNRLTVWGSGDDTTTYSYDAVGNRTDQFVWGGGAIQSSTNYAIGGLGPNQLTSLQKYTGGGSPINGPTSYGYDADGAVVSRTAMISGGGGGGGMTPRTETFSYSWRDLLRKYTTPTNSPTAVTDWRYRYSAGGEREQKRMYTWRQLNDTLFHTRAWVYYALGGGKEQLGVYHGLEVAFDNPDLLCEGPSDDRVYFYPVEYNTFGGGISRITTRPNALSSAGIKEYKIADHLGSTRLGIDAVTGVTRTVDYEPFGTAVTGLGGAGTPRQSFIDKEKDYENGYGDFGVRKFEEETGRFLSTDALASKFMAWSPYQYGLNSPATMTDGSGLEVDVAQLMESEEGKGVLASIVGQWQKISGLKLAVHGTKIVILGQGEGGSSQGRALIREMINHSQTVRIVSTNEGGSRTIGNTIVLDRNQIGDLSLNMKGAYNGTIHFGMTVLHEYLHTRAGGGFKHAKSMDVGEIDAPDVVGNVIRGQLGPEWGQLTSHKTVTIGAKVYYPFSPEALDALICGEEPASGYTWRWLKNIR